MTPTGRAGRGTGALPWTPEGARRMGTAQTPPKEYKMTSTNAKPVAPAKKVAAKADAQPANESPAVETATGAVQAVIEAAAQVAYLPASDSTPDLKERAEKENKVILDLSDNACLCGCKGQGPSRFLPGHDARLKGKLVRATVADVKLLIVMGADEQEVTARQFAKVLTGKYDWVKGLDESVARLELQEKAKEQRRVENEKKAAERKAAAAERGKGKISLADFSK